MLRLGLVGERRDLTGHVLDIGIGEQQEVGIAAEPPRDTL